LVLPHAALTDRPELTNTLAGFAPPTQPFTDLDPFHELAFPTPLAAKRVIADYLGLPLARLPPEQLAALNALLTTTLSKEAVFDFVRRYLKPLVRG
jgi:hypothetical protein